MTLVCTEIVQGEATCEQLYVYRTKNGCV